MKINIDGQEMEELLSKAILASLDEAKREIVHGVAQRIANEMIASDEVVMGKIRALIDDALMKVLEENRENVVSKVALAIWTTTYDGAWIKVGSETVDLFDVERAVRELKVKGVQGDES